MRILIYSIIIIGVIFIWYVVVRFHSFLVVSIPLQRADAIVLLAGAYQERAPVAARLFREGGAPRVILTNDGVFSSWSQKYQRNLYNIEWTTELLAANGVPRSAVVQLPFVGSGTIYDAIAVRDYCRMNNIHTLLLVTSDYHTRRAFWTFSTVMSRESVTLGIIPVTFPTNRWQVVWEVITETIKGSYYYLRYHRFHITPLATSSIDLCFHV